MLFRRPLLSASVLKRKHIIGHLHTSAKFRQQAQQQAKMTSSLPKLPIIDAISRHDPQSVAIVHSQSGRSFTYGDLLSSVLEQRNLLQTVADSSKLGGSRIAFLVENSYDYVVSLLSAMAVHSIAVPLSPTFPVQELQYILDHSQASLLLTSERFEVKAQAVLERGLQTDCRLIKLKKRLSSEQPVDVSLEETVDSLGGMMLYTSGTTSRPKGVVLPQSAITAQAQSLLKAWEYSSNDYLLHILPLHHIHGTINALITPLFAGSTIEFAFPFNAQAVWERFAEPYLPSVKTANKITFFTAVPTVYSRLLTTYKELAPPLQEAARKGISPKNLRLNISGSAALPTPIKQAWRDLSGGNVLLERYGMTEIGMALSCGLLYSDRVDGSVGWPLPSVEVRLVDSDTHTVIQEGEEMDQEGKERDGEIQVRGPTVFKEYFRNGTATIEEFVNGDDGKGKWFKTGDIAVRRLIPNAGRSAQDWARGPLYFIKGRRSADIIKTGGEKVSALEVERELLSLPQIAEAAVVAVPSGKWGQKVGAVIVLTTDIQNPGRTKWSPMEIRRALKDVLANYKIPQIIKFVDEIPKNAMGKVNKIQLVKSIFIDDMSGDEI